MRITGGKIRGRVLFSPRGMDIRPTTDRVREAIFDILGQDMSGLKVLDLFAGTGIFGIEALSRGAGHAVFIDNSKQALNLIKKNLSLCGFEDSATILKADLKKVFRLNHQMLRAIDLIFLDPPYGKDLIIPLLEWISQTDTLRYGASVIAELSRKEDLPDTISRLKVTDIRLYGDTKIIIYTSGRDNERKDGNLSWDI
ncbi:RNA methyltransferase, RsmD family [uncultured Desulfobacterium sp.]|uniref:RNA methyltransferase, RsmD family n=1 Tax=uncultured Desulfobacterium sp. TaxID=201089 RepID=A0A445MRT6_9BACT|nr:RNA methyltransferase, RsmD family [uncultured Desulfobacterium sp.]